jgi:hypothetical protein
LTLTLDQLEQRTGLVTTGHGGQLTATQALRLAGEADVIPIVIDQQRRTLAGRDRGCVFPGSDHPPDWTEAHHITPGNTAAEPTWTTWPSSATTTTTTTSGPAGPSP